MEQQNTKRAKVTSIPVCHICGEGPKSGIFSHSWLRKHLSQWCTGNASSRIALPSFNELTQRASEQEKNATALGAERDLFPFPSASNQGTNADSQHEFSTISQLFPSQNVKIRVQQQPDKEEDKSVSSLFIKTHGNKSKDSMSSLKLFRSDVGHDKNTDMTSFKHCSTTIHTQEDNNHIILDTSMRPYQDCRDDNIGTIRLQSIDEYDGPEAAGDSVSLEPKSPTGLSCADQIDAGSAYITCFDNKSNPEEEQQLGSASTSFVLDSERSNAHCQLNEHMLHDSVPHTSNETNVDLTIFQAHLINTYYKERNKFRNIPSIADDDSYNRLKDINDREDLIKEFTDTITQMHHNPAEYAIRQYIAKFPLKSSAAGDELLRLIRYLSSYGMLEYTQTLPITMTTLFRHDERLGSNMRDATLGGVTDTSGLGSVHDATATAPDHLLNQTSNKHQQSGVVVSSITMDDAGEWVIPFPHFNILSLIGDMLISVEHEPNAASRDINFDYSTRRTNDTDEQLYDEIFSGDWWKEVSSLNHAYKILSIILYMDGVSVDFFSRVHMTPVVVTLGNFTRKNRDSIKGKRLLAFIPSISDMDIRTHTTEDPAFVRRKFKQRCLAVLLRPILCAQNKGGIIAFVGKSNAKSNKFLLYPCMTFFVGDNLELTTLAGVKAGNRTARQCRCCECPSNQMHDYRQLHPFRDAQKVDDGVADATRRTKKALQDFLSVQSLYHPRDNFLFINAAGLFGLGARRTTAFYEAFPPDNLHTLLAGIMRYAVSWTLDIVKYSVGEAALLKLDTAISSYHTGSATDSEFQFSCPAQGVSHIVKLIEAARKRKKILKKGVALVRQFRRGGKTVKKQQNSDTSQIECEDNLIPKNSKAPKYTTNFESRKWASVLMAVGCVLGCSDEDEYLPSCHPLYGNIRDDVILALFLCLDLYFELVKTEYTERNIRELERYTIPNTTEAVYDIFLIRQQIRGLQKHFTGYKLHILIHIPRLIRRFGAPCNWDTASFETSHKKFVKERWESGSKQLQHLEQRILQVDEYYCILTSMCGIDRQGNITTFYRETEQGISTHVRAWKSIVWDNHEENLTIGRQLIESNPTSMTYRFLHNSFPLAFNCTDDDQRSSGNRKKKVRWNLKHDEDKKKYSIDPVVRSYLLPLLVQYSQASGGRYLQNVFRDEDNIKLGNLEILLNDHICIAGSGALEGYETFTIHANILFGRNKMREGQKRLDFVEICIPKTKGGKIAANEQLLRTSDDFAIAQVRAIVILRHLETEVPLLFVMFMRNGLGRSRPPAINSKANKNISYYVNRFELLSYGYLCQEWVALYPLVNLKGPSLGVPDVKRSNFFHIFPLQYLSRGNWYDESIQMVTQAIHNRARPCLTYFQYEDSNKKYENDSSENEDDWEGIEDVLSFSEEEKD